jgi:predicted ATPase
VIIRRYVLTGAPGAGKTTLAEALRRRGYVVVPEAATDVVAAGGEGDGFVDTVLALQLARERAATAPVQVLDRSPLCTLALARWLGVTPSPALLAAAAGAADRYQPGVFLVRPLGFVTPTAVRRISYADSLRFAAVHEDAYREYGFTLIEVPAAPLADRVALTEDLLRRAQDSAPAAATNRSAAA